jgi:predicted SAM-dependent methyltransferase
MRPIDGLSKYSASEGKPTLLADRSPTLRDYVAGRSISRVKLHLGCGGVRWRDFINVDLNPALIDERDNSRDGCVADVFADMRDLGLPDDSVDEIFTSHTIDHFTRWNAVKMFSDWHRMLKPGGLLTIEVADFVRCVLWLFHPIREKRRLARTQFYGNQWDEIEYETHRYVWSSRELKIALLDIGFTSVAIHHRTLTHYPGRDMHVEARK